MRHCHSGIVVLNFLLTVQDIHRHLDNYIKCVSYTRELIYPTYETAYDLLLDIVITIFYQLSNVKQWYISCNSTTWLEWYITKEWNYSWYITVYIWQFFYTILHTTVQSGISGIQLIYHCSQWYISCSTDRPLCTMVYHLQYHISAPIK